MPIVLPKLDRHRSRTASEDAALLQSMVVESKRWDESFTAFYQFQVPRQRPGLERYSHTPGAPLSTFPDKLCSNRPRCVAQRLR